MYEYTQIVYTNTVRYTFLFTYYNVFLLIILNFSGDCDKDGTVCSNGACLDSQCHCNDGYGGCNCQVPGMFLYNK